MDDLFAPVWIQCEIVYANKGQKFTMAKDWNGKSKIWMTSGVEKRGSEGAQAKDSHEAWAEINGKYSNQIKYVIVSCSIIKRHLNENQL